jgi:TatD DNase family protein
MWIDCHAHLDRLSEKELAVVLAEAADAGVASILSTATGLTSAAAVIRQCEIFPSLYGAVGISPFEVLSLPDSWEDSLRSYLMKERMVAVGEIGLDASNPRYPSLKHQLPIFERQLRIAKDLHLPAVVHSRGAEKEVTMLCRSLGIPDVLFHCFTGDRATLQFILGCGYYVSFSGIITFNTAVNERVKEVPLERLFIETDTPYLAPVPHRGKTNRPAWAAMVGEAAARSKGVTVGELKKALQKNFSRLFLR